MLCDVCPVVKSLKIYFSGHVPIIALTRNLKVCAFCFVLYFGHIGQCSGAISCSVIGLLWRSDRAAVGIKSLFLTCSLYTLDL